MTSHVFYPVLTYFLLRQEVWVNIWKGLSFLVGFTGKQFFSLTRIDQQAVIASTELTLIKKSMKDVSPWPCVTPASGLSHSLFFHIRTCLFMPQENRTHCGVSLWLRLDHVDRVFCVSMWECIFVVVWIGHLLSTLLPPTWQDCSVMHAVSLQCCCMSSPSLPSSLTHFFQVEKSRDFAGIYHGWNIYISCTYGFIYIREE